MNEEDKVWDGEKTYTKKEYIENVYPNLKETSKLTIVALQNREGYEGSYNCDSEADFWSVQLLEGIVPEDNKKW